MEERAAEQRRSLAKKVQGMQSRRGAAQHQTEGLGAAYAFEQDRRPLPGALSSDVGRDQTYSEMCGRKGGRAWPPLLRAAYDGDLATVQAELRRGADVNVTMVGAGQKTPLYYATRFEYPSIVRLLLSQPGVDVNRQMRPSKGGSWTSPLIAAKEWGPSSAMYKVFEEFDLLPRCDEVLASGPGGAQASPVPPTLAALAASAGARQAGAPARSSAAPPPHGMPAHEFPPQPPLDGAGGAAELDQAEGYAGGFVESRHRFAAAESACAACGYGRAMAEFGPEDRHALPARARQSMKEEDEDEEWMGEGRSRHAS